LLVPRPVAATAIANSTLSFSNLSIVSASGTLTLDDVWLLQAFASANNSRGESDAQFNFAFSPDSTSASSSPAVTWATASAGATALGNPADLNVSGSASGSINIPGTGGVLSDAFSEAFGNVSNFFTIGGNGVVAVQFAVDISGNLSVFTDGSGLNAFADSNFNLEVDGNPVLFDHRQFDIGPSLTQTQSFSTHLTNTVLLDAGVSHLVIVQGETDPHGHGQAPEPASSALLLVGFGALLWANQRGRNVGRIRRQPRP
jgi:hypothetical protein